MSRITLDQLRASIGARRQSVDDAVDLAVVTAENVVVEYLGADWVGRYLRGPEGAYFRAVSERPDDGFLYHDRLLSLAETLLNLQGTPGISDVLGRLQRGEIEPCVAELEAARFLDLCQLSFRFHTRQLKHGHDYDLEVDLPAREHLPCEGKCKLENTPLTYSSVKQTLETARKQLPKNGSGVIIMKLPGAHMADPRRRREVGSAVVDLFKRSGRVGGVIAWWELWEYGANAATKRVMYRNDGNPRSRTPVPMEVFQPRPRRSSWIDLFHLTGLSGGYRVV